MRAVWISKRGGPEVLEVRETPDPAPQAGEVRVRVRAAGLNFAEIMARQGLYPDAPKLPCVVGYEVSGVIDQLGEGVPRAKLGKRVIALTRFGGHSDTVCVPAIQTREMPDAMSFEDGAALPVNYITALHMLRRITTLRSGSRVLVHMAAGGVGIAALQLCRSVPGVTTFGTSSPSKHAFLREHGCDHPIDYRSQDYVAEVMRLTDGKGVDVVLDALGGDDWKRGYSLLRPAGILITFGFANMASGEKLNVFNIVRNFLSVPRFSPLALMDKNRAVAGVNVGHLWEEIPLLTEALDQLVELYSAGTIKPVIDSIYPFEQAADAHRRLHERKNVGKVLLVPQLERRSISRNTEQSALATA